MTLRRLTVLAGALMLLATACSSSTTAEQSISESPSSVTITSGTGNVSVSAINSGATVTADISASGDEPQWSAELVGDELIIDDGCGDRTDCRVDLVIEVAGTADVSIETADGGVTVVDMNSTIAVSGATRNVGLNGITGPIMIDLTEGDVLGARLVSTEASFHTGDGDIDVTLTEAFTSLSVTSDKGDVTAQVPDGDYDVDATGTGSIDVKVGDVDGSASSIVMSTGSGDVTIYKR